MMVPSLAHCILIIVKMGPGERVERMNASSVIAVVAEEKIVRNWSNKMLIREPMRPHLLPIDSEFAVPVYLMPHPNPA